MRYKDLNITDKQKFYSLLCEMITPQRKLLIEKNIDQRTDRIIPVIENIHKSQNASAVLRTCDCLGLQKVMVIENNNKFSDTEDISLGANKWLDIQKYNGNKDNTAVCFDNLRNKGYKIIATMPYKNDINLQDVDISGKIAVVFGSEVDGISQSAIEHADCFMKIPMYGFTESFNISVAAAIVLYHLTFKLRNSDIDWHLDGTAKLDTMIEWALRTVKNPLLIENELLKQF